MSRNQKNVSINNIKNGRRVDPYIIISVIISAFVSIAPAIYLSELYYSKQKSFFQTANSLLFIHDDISLFLFIFTPMIIVFLIMLKVFKKDIQTIFGVGLCTIAIVSISVISTFLLVNQFYSYCIVSDKSLSLRNGLLYEYREYNWKDIKGINVTYHYTKSSINIDYFIRVDDFIQFNASDSDEFYEKIGVVDDLVRKKNVVIKRSQISNNEYLEFEKLCNTGNGLTDTEKLNTILKLFKE